MQKTYTVSGPFAFRGNEPGSTFEADPKDRHIHRAIARGAISASTEGTSLDALSRDELDALAIANGVEDPAALPNKDAVKAAIAEVTTNEPDNAGDAGGKE